MASLNPNLKEFWRVKARNRVLHGGRSSSKSWDAAAMAVILGQNYKIRFLCTRQFQNKIEESVYSLLKSQIDRLGLTGYKILKNKIIHTITGSEFLFYGLWRHIDEIKSLEGIDICWIEEAHNLSSAQWEILEPTIRKQGSQFWIIFNPKFATDFVWQRFVVKPPPKTIVRQINYPENPFLSDTILDVIEAKKAEDFDDYEHIYLGVPRNDDEGCIIRMSWLMAAVDADKTLGVDFTGPKNTGFDVADGGADLCATVGFNGSRVEYVEEWKAREDELDKSTYRALANARKIDQNCSVIYDSIGVGAGTGAFLNGVGFKDHMKFNAGGKVVNPKQLYCDIKNADFFSNIKAQAWWLVADRLKNTYNAVHNGHTFAPDEMICISSECAMLDKMLTELACVKRDYDNQGRVKVESKKDLDKRDIPSPNLADAFILGAIKGLVLSGRKVATAW